MLWQLIVEEAKGMKYVPYSASFLQSPENDFSIGQMNGKTDLKELESRSDFPACS